MARRRRAPARTRRRVARRNPRRRYGPSTRAGQPRKTARRAYARANPRRRVTRRRPARRNQRAVFQSPAFMYGASAVAGAAAASVLNGYGDVARAKADAEALASGTEPKYGMWMVLAPKIGDYQVHPGIIGAAVMLGIASTKLIKTAKTRAMLVAGGVGMLAPAAIDAATQAFMPKSNPRHPSAYRLRQMRRLNAGPPSTSNYTSAAHFAQDLIPS